ncbi:MAG: hypothetical protein ACRDP6_29500 [Actinoallomurus sp.]
MRKYITAPIGAVVGSLFWGGLVVLAIRFAAPLIVRALAQDGDGKTVMIWPRGGSWWAAWILVTAAGAAVAVPRELVQARRVAKRSRKLSAFVLWRRAGRYQLHRPQGGVVPIDAYKLTGWVKSKDVRMAQVVAAMTITKLTGRNVARWEPDKSARSMSADSSWIAYLAEEDDEVRRSTGSGGRDAGPTV